MYPAQPDHAANADRLCDHSNDWDIRADTDKNGQLAIRHAFTNHNPDVS